MFGVISGFVRGKDTTSIKNKIHVDVLTEATMRAISGCQVTANLSQTVQINCTDNAINSAGCRACFDMIAKTRTSRDVIGLQSGAGVADEWPTTDVCASACTSCITKDVTQSQVVQLKSTCDVFANFDVEIKNKIAESIEEVMAKQEDVTGAIGKIFGGPQKSEALNEYTGALNNVISREFSNQLKTDIIAHQNITIGKKSVIVQHVNQTVNAAMIASLIAKSKVQDRVFNQQQIDAAMAIIRKDTTIADLIDGLTKATVEPLDFMASTMGLIIIVTTVGIAIVVIVLFIIGIWRPKFYSMLGDAAEKRLGERLGAA